jgi:RNA polymerase sigma-70 factor (ECF subfamily)
VDLDEPLVTWEQKNRIQTVLNNLPRKDRELLRAVYLEEADKDEICRRLRVDGDYLRVLIHRAKSRFRKVYQQQFGNGAVSQLTM